MPDAFPKLRGEIDASPVTHEGTVYYIVYDRAGVAPARLAVTPLALEVASRLDGHTSVLDLTDQVRHATGVVLTCSEVDAVVDTLDRSLFLDNAFFQDHLAQADRDFQASPLRPASSAGSAYPDDPGELATELERLLSSAPPPEESLAREGAAPAGAIVPHIDFSRGGHAYGQLYSFLRSRPAPETVVVVGTAHLPLPGRYSLCLKDFATPLGQLPLDRERSEVIRRHLAPYGGVEQGLLAHRGEHSVELQAVWLRHIYGDQVGLVPLLAASLGDFSQGGDEVTATLADPACRAMREALGELLAAGGVMLLASADLAHVGPRFGDQREINQDFLAEVEAADREYLAEVAGDATAGLDCLRRREDCYHVCGSASIFTVGGGLSPRRGRLLGYHQAASHETRQAVTFASMVFE